ncbi:MAG TPA: hypothetical protein VNK52_16265 [Hyphomicrobiaceae bacterium]|nr:hypothetical protein [Hyphomicrobiaceae bacterium]
MNRRRKLTRDERYAAVILMLRRGNGEPIVSYREALTMTAREIIDTFESRVHWDHNIPVAWGGPTHPANMTPLAIEDHANKTRRDLKAIAKVKRAVRKATKRKRPMPGSRASKWRKRMDGTVEARP